MWTRDFRTRQFVVLVAAALFLAVPLRLPGQLRPPTLGAKTEIQILCA